MVDIATSLIAAVMSAYQLISPPPPTTNEIPHCYQSIENYITRCYYSADYSALSNEIRTSVGRYMMLGPWALEEDMRDPIIFAAVGNASVVANVKTRGVGYVIPSGPGVMFNVEVDMRQPDFAVKVEGKSLHIDNANFIDVRSKSDGR